MPIYLAILDIIDSSTQLLGWYGIDTRLGRRGIIVEENLVRVLDSLIQQGYLEHRTHAAHPHGIYLITPSGKTFLAERKVIEQ